MPIRSYVNGEMSWGLLYRITGNIWAGLGGHLFNNTVAANMLHVVSQNGADKLQIVRIMAAQIISFAFVIAIIIARKETQNSHCVTKEAKLMEDRRIFTGSPCRNSHTGTRDTAELQAAWGEE